MTAPPFALEPSPPDPQVNARTDLQKAALRLYNTLSDAIADASHLGDSADAQEVERRVTSDLSRCMDLVESIVHADDVPSW